jgi:hypothetical protein
VFLNAGHRWWGARISLPSSLIRISWSFNAARGALLRDSFAVIATDMDITSLLEKSDAFAVNLVWIDTPR